MFFLCLLFILGSCNNEKKESIYGHIYLQNGFKKKDFYRLSEIAEEIDYIFLETNDSCLMTDIKEVIYDPPYYFIMDNNEKSIFIFNEAGNFVNTISALGQGPQEYTMIYSFDVFDNILYIYDYNQRKILKYMVNGKFINAFRIEEWASYIKPVNEDIIYLASGNTEVELNEGYVFSQYDKNFNLKRKFKKMKHNGSERSYIAYSFYNQRDTLVYWEYNIFDTVYNVLPEGRTEARFIIDPGAIPSSLNRRRDQYLVESSQFDISSIIETDDFVFLFCVYHRSACPLIFLKNENQTVGIDNSLMNDIDGGASFWPFFKISNNKVGDSMFPEELKNYLKKEITEYHSNFNFQYFRPKTDYNVEKHKRLLEQLEKTDEMSNPVLMIVTMKSSINHE